MVRLQVIVNALHKRSEVPAQLPDANGIAGIVLEGFNFIGEEVSAAEIPNVTTGKWYKDRDGYFYWGGGLLVIDEYESLVEEPVAKELVETITGKKDWGFIDFKIDEVWKKSKGKNITVSILDTGLNFNLDEFVGIQDIGWYDAVKNSSNKNDCMETDLKGHGTDCAAILCAKGKTLFGAAPEIHLNVIKIADASGQRTLALAINGLTKAIELNSDVISISFSVSKTNDNAAELEAMHDLIKQAYDQHITIVASAGNSGGLAFPVNNFPAAFPECLSIGGIDRNRKRSKFSSKSNFLDLMGPGENLFSLSNPASPINGTSFSTPFVAGVVAMIKSASKANGRVLHNLEIFDILKRSADKNIPDYNVVDYGWGILDPPAALKLLSLI